VAKSTCQETQCRNLPLAPKRDDHPSTLVILFLVDLRREADGAHDAIPELLVQDRLVRESVGLDDFE
jgi:hypothetical protein